MRVVDSEISEMEDKNIGEQIDAIIGNIGDWRGEKLSNLRSIIRNVNRDIIEEIKWRKPSRPEGVPVWSLNGIICVADILKERVRLTFPQGTKIQGCPKLFNTRLESKTVRAIDFYKDDVPDRECLSSIIREAVSINSEKKLSKKKGV